MANPPSAPPPSAMPPGALPYSPEAEEAAIGAVLINPALLHSLQAILRPDDFFYARNQFIWQALERLLARNERIDFLTLTEELRDHEQLEEVGGEAEIIRLFRATPSSAHAEAYARIVERASTRRRLMVAADEIKELALDESKPLEEVTSEAESKLFNITEGREQRDMVPLRKAISEYFDRIEYLHGHPNETLGLPSGFRDLDRLLGGCQKSDLLICAGRPGMGKTSFLLSVALNAARFGGRVVIFTMEMGARTDHAALRLDGNLHQHAAPAPGPAERPGIRALRGSLRPHFRAADLYRRFSRHQPDPDAHARAPRLL